VSIVRLVPQGQKEPNKHAIELLEDILSLAKTGDVVEVALVAIYQDHEVEHAFTPCRLSALMLGAVTRLQHKISERISEVEYAASNPETTDS
jgi:hypothetical protein